MNTWQTIDSAPKDGTQIIIAWLDGQCWEQRMVSWDSEHSFKWNDETEESDLVGAWTDHAVESWAYQETFSYQPSHWMPCPDPPN